MIWRDAAVLSVDVLWSAGILGIRVTPNMRLYWYIQNAPIRERSGLIVCLSMAILYSVARYVIQAARRRPYSEPSQFWR